MKKKLAKLAGWGNGLKDRIPHHRNISSKVIWSHQIFEVLFSYNYKDKMTSDEIQWSLHQIYLW